MKLRYMLTVLVAGATIAGLTAASTPSQNNSAPPAAAVEPVRLTSNAQDILKLSRAKVNDDVTVAFIKNGSRRFDLTASEIVFLRQEGVSDRVLAAMLGHQPDQTSAAPVAPPTAEPAPVASAPQYVESPGTTAMVETGAPSTVYVMSSTPAYYAFNDPWPYSYNSWPYYYSGWYAYPYFSFGWYWGSGGNCYYGYHGYHGDCWDNDHCDNSGSHSQKSDGHASSTRVPPTRGDTASERSSAGVSQMASPAGARSTTAPSARSTPVSRSASAGGSQPANAGIMSAAASPGTRSVGGERSVPVSRTIPAPANATQVVTANPAGSRSVRSTSTWTSMAANNRSVVVRPTESQASVQLARGPSARPTSTWSAGASQTPAARPVINQSAIAVAPTSRVGASPTTTWSQAGGQAVNRSVSYPVTSYQRSSTSPGYSSRAMGNGASYSRPSMSAPTRSMGSSSAVRSGGSYGGGSRSMSSGGGSRSSAGGGRSR